MSDGGGEGQKEGPRRPPAPRETGMDKGILDLVPEPLLTPPRETGKGWGGAVGPSAHERPVESGPRGNG